MDWNNIVDLDRGVEEFIYRELMYGNQAKEISKSWYRKEHVVCEKRIVKNGWDKVEFTQEHDEREGEHSPIKTTIYHYYHLFKLIVDITSWILFLGGMCLIAYLGYTDSYRLMESRGIEKTKGNLALVVGIMSFVFSFLLLFLKTSFDFTSGSPMSMKHLQRIIKKEITFYPLYLIFSGALIGDVFFIFNYLGV